MGILSNIRVLDLTRVVAGPYCTMLLGDLGAEVIKVEQPGKGDDCRHWPPFVNGISTYFFAVNRNKKSICLDLHRTEGAAIARGLSGKSDIVVENFRPGVMGQFGLDYESLRAENPGLIYCSVTGFGQTGPYRDRAGYDPTVQALGGLMSITGTPGGPPVKPGIPLLDVSVGLYAFSGILGALFHRERTGKGQRLDVSLLKTQLATLLNAASGYLLAGVIQGPEGNAHPNIAPYQAFRASDGYIVIGAASDKLFERFCSLMGHPEWASDSRFVTNAARAANRQQLETVIESVLHSDTAAEWERKLAAAGIAVGPVNTIDQVFQDPHIAASGQVISISHPELGNVKAVGPAVEYELTPAEVSTAAPRLGEHTCEVLRDLIGARSEDLARWDADGVT